jgi:predicted DNA-binding protein (MmcQ/YjbR family)
MTKVDPHLVQLRRIVATLPEAVEDTPWGSIHWKVRGKIFAGWDRDEEGASSIGFKTDKDLQATLVHSDPRFSVAAYVGKHGWVDMDLGDAPDWHEVEHFLVESYKMIAPSKLAAAISSAPMPARALGGRPGPKPRGATRAPRRAAARKSPRGTK